MPMTFIRETCVFVGHVDLSNIDFYVCPGPEILAKGRELSKNRLLPPLTLIFLFL